MSSIVPTRNEPCRGRATFRRFRRAEMLFPRILLDSLLNRLIALSSEDETSKREASSQMRDP